MKQWNLSVLYKDFEDPQLAKDIAYLQKRLAEFTEFTEAFSRIVVTPALVLNYYDFVNELTSYIDVLYNFGELNYAVDTNNSKALKLIETVESFSPEITVAQVRYRKWLKSYDATMALVKNNPELVPYKFDIEQSLNLAQYMLSDEEEALLAKMQNTGSNAWSKLQDNAIASLTAPIEGKETPITIVRNLAFDQSSRVRKDAYNAELASYSKIETISAAALNAIKGEVITTAQTRGYESPLSMTLESARMDRQTLDAMMTAIKEYLPHFRRYLKKKASLLGHSQGLPFYDLFAPVGEADLTYTYDEARDFIVSNFTSYSQALGDFAANAFDNDWIDPEPREGKVAGAFCSNIHSKKESRIMANFTGSFNDVSTLAHELGHGYHGECLKDVLPVNSDYPMPLAETASIFCETIITNAALKTASKENAFAILENSVMSSNQVITDIYSRYLFETALFEARKDSSLSVKALKDAMIHAQKEAYGDGLDESYLHPYMWVCKPHYYSAGYNFYNFPYAFGLLFAKGLYAMYLKEGQAFLPKYDRLLEATGCNNIKDVLATVGVDAHDPEFFRSSLEQIKKEIETILAY